MAGGGPADLNSARPGAEHKKWIAKTSIIILILFCENNISLRSVVYVCMCACLSQLSYKCYKINDYF